MAVISRRGRRNEGMRTIDGARNAQILEASRTEIQAKSQKRAKTQPKPKMYSETTHQGCDRVNGRGKPEDLHARLLIQARNHPSEDEETDET